LLLLWEYDNINIFILKTSRNIRFIKYIAQILKPEVMQNEALWKYAGKGMFFKKAVDRNCKYTECRKSGNLL